MVVYVVKGFGFVSFIMATPPLLMEAEDLLVPLMLAWSLLTAAAQYFVDAPLAAMTASGLLQCDPQSLAVSPTPLCTTFQAPSGWMGSISHFQISAEMFHQIQGHPQSCPEATSCPYLGRVLGAER